MTSYEVYFGHCERNPEPNGVWGEVKESLQIPYSDRNCIYIQVGFDFRV